MAAAPPRRSLPVVGGISLGAIGLALVALILLALLIWLFWPTGGLPTRERVIQEISIVTPPPPPPEPEEKIMEEEPEIIEPTEEPEIQKDVEQPSEQPSEAPSEAPSSEPAGLDRAADAGSDSFRLAAGGGGGLFGRGGGGGGGGSWGSYVETHIRRALQRDPQTRAAAGFVNVVVDIDTGGRFIGARLRSTTGKADLDGAIQRVLGTLPPLGRPLPAKQGGRTYATINMKRTGG